MPAFSVSQDSRVSSCEESVESSVLLGIRVVSEQWLGAEGVSVKIIGEEDKNW